MKARPLLATAATVALAIGIASSAHWWHRARGPTVFGVHLGMSAADARHAFDPGAPGSVAVEPDGALEWSATAARPSDPDRVRIELREDAVVALRIWWPPSPRAAILRAI